VVSSQYTVFTFVLHIAVFTDITAYPTVSSAKVIHLRKCTTDELIAPFSPDAIAQHEQDQHANENKWEAPRPAGRWLAGLER
jgi:hypothetical protein